MLTFTNAQGRFLLDQRAQWNTGQQTLLGNAAGLPVEFWRELDRNISMVPRDILAVFNDLSASVSRPVPFGVIDHAFAVAGDSGTTHVSLDGVWTGGNDLPEYQNFSTSVPILQHQFTIPYREVEGARAMGWSIDEAPRDNSLRTVAEQAELITLNGSAKIVRNGVPLYGLRNHPARITSTMGVTLNGATGAEWMAEVKALLESLEAQNYFGPVTIYLNVADYRYAQRTDYSELYPNKTIMQRMMELGNVTFVEASKMTANEMVGVIKQRSVVQVLSAMPLAITPRARLNGDDPYSFRSIQVAGLQLRQDANGVLGVAHRA